jgi:hypothetical protein
VRGLANPDVTEFLKKRHPAVAVALVIGMSLATGFVVGGAAVWALKRAGYPVEG